MILFTNNDLEDIMNSPEVIPQEQEPIEIQVEVEPEQGQELLEGPKEKDLELAAILTDCLKEELDRLTRYNSLAADFPEYQYEELNGLFVEMANQTASYAGKIQKLLCAVSPNAQNILCNNEECAGQVLPEEPVLFTELHENKGKKYIIQYIDYTPNGKALKEELIKSPKSKEDIAKLLRKKFEGVEIKSIKEVLPQPKKFVESFIGSKPKCVKTQTKTTLNEDYAGTVPIEAQFKFCGANSINKDITLAKRISDLISQLLSLYVDMKYKDID